MNVLFNEVYTYKEQMQYIEDAIKNKTDYKEKVISLMKEKYDVNDIMLSNSASNAIDLILLSLKLEKGSEVILPSFTYPSVANSVVRLGLKPVFVEVDKNTLTNDFDEIVKKTTKKTSCIIPCHYGGASVNMDRLMTFANENNLYVIEDAATCFGAKFEDRYLGTIGHAGIISFDTSKNIAAETGGMLFLNDLSDEIKERVQINYDNGTNRSKFLSKEVSHYSWQLPGLSVKMSNLHASYLYSQLIKQDDVLAIRKKLFDYYYEHLKDFCIAHKWKMTHVESYNENNYHVFYIMFNNNAEREKMRELLKDKNVTSYTHYTPLHSSEMGQKLGYQYSDFSITNHIDNCILRLPLHNMMTIEQAAYVVNCIKEY